MLNENTIITRRERTNEEKNTTSKGRRRRRRREVFIKIKFITLLEESQGRF